MNGREWAELTQSLLPEPRNPRGLLFSLMAVYLGVLRAPWFYIFFLIMLSATYEMTRMMLLMRRPATGEEVILFYLQSLIVNGGIYVIAMGAAWLLAAFGFPILT